MIDPDAATEIVQVDAFSDRPFAGNPAAICVLTRAAAVGWMQRLAGEMNLSETAYLVPRGDVDAGWDLRWFTPEAEVDLCGHATLAAAHVLWEDDHLPAGREARFHTASGLLTARRGDDGWIAMDFPSEAVGAPASAATIATLKAALGVVPVFAAANRQDMLVEVADETTLRQLDPDPRLLVSVARGIIVTARADDAGLDFVSRFFAPAVGVDEDPVTGSAHACLAPYWAAKLGVDRLTGYQASSRGGVVRTAVKGNRVEISGQAVTVMRGRLYPAATGESTGGVPPKGSSSKP